MKEMPEEEILKKMQFDSYEDMVSFLRRIRSLKKSKPLVLALMEETNGGNESCLKVKSEKF